MASKQFRSTVSYTPAPPATASDGTPVQPAPLRHDVLATVNAPLNVQTDSGSEVQIRVQPDHRFILMTMISAFLGNLTTSMLQSSSYASIPTYIGYSLAMIFAHAFHSDVNLASDISFFAQQVLNSNAVLAKIYDDMLDYLIPPPIAMLFESLQPFRDEIATNLSFVHSLECFSLLHDFGRYFPIGTFFGLHNILATLPANTDHYRVLYEFLVANVLTANDTTAGANPAAYNFTAGNLFAAARQNAAGTGNDFYHNWLFDALERIVASQSIRPVFAGPTTAPLRFDTNAVANLNGFNPYIVFLNYSASNSTNLRTVLRNISAHVKDTFPSAKPLRAFLQPGTNMICRYLSYEYGYPTFHTGQVHTAAWNPAAPQMSRATVFNSHHNMAETLDLLTPPADPATAPANGNSFFNLIQFPRPAANPNDDSIQLVERNAPPANTADPISYRTRDQDRYSTPVVAISDPYSNGRDHLGIALLSGIAIETGEVSLLGVLVEDTSSHLHIQNATHLSGSIPIDRTYSVGQHTWVHVARQSFGNIEALPAVHFRGYASRATAPIYRQGIVNMIENAAHPQQGDFLPGYTYLRHARHAFTATNVFAAPVGQSPPRVNYPTVQIWSPYRHRRNPNATIVILPSLRAIYGSRLMTRSSAHPAAILF